MIQKVKLVTDPEEAREVYDFIKELPFDYPDYLRWAEKCFREMQLGYKKAFVCRESGKVVASLVFQMHKEDHKVLELKNGRVSPGFKRKKVFTALYGAVEKYAKENGFQKIICDTHSDNITVIKTMEKLGFRSEGEEGMYSSKLEVILAKDLD